MSGAHCLSPWAYSKVTRITFFTMALRLSNPSKSGSSWRVTCGKGMTEMCRHSQNKEISPLSYKAKWEDTYCWPWKLRRHAEAFKDPSLETVFPTTSLLGSYLLLVRQCGIQGLYQMNSYLHSTLCVKAMIFLILLDRAMDDHRLYLKTCHPGRRFVSRGDISSSTG